MQPESATINSPDKNFIQRCVSDILNGLTHGLTHFSGQSRVALIYALRKDDPLIICDPQHLLTGHEPAFRSLFIDDQDWRKKADVFEDISSFSTVQPEYDLGLAGLISHGGYSRSVFFQRWFTEHHPEICSTLPTERWLEHAVWRFSHDMARTQEQYTGISGSFLREYATHAVRDCIVDLMNIHLGWDSSVRIYPVLDAVLALSGTREEGMWPEGKLLVTDPRLLDQVKFLVRFNPGERPQLRNYKHVRKLLLTVERSSRQLLSDGKSILGIIDDTVPTFSICAEFKKRRGFLNVNQMKICSFVDGHFGSTTHRAKLVQLEERLLESDLDSNTCSFLFKSVLSLVHHARRRKHGCAIVLDLNPKPVKIAGQCLMPALDLRCPEMLEMAKSLAKVDGALHIGVDLCLHGFSCLLDGLWIGSEDLARGARYNSALRFTAQHQNIIVIVVSSDRPVSVIEDGVELQGFCSFEASGDCVYGGDLLEHWSAR